MGYLIYIPVVSVAGGKVRMSLKMLFLITQDLLSVSPAKGEIDVSFQNFFFDLRKLFSSLFAMFSPGLTHRFVGPFIECAAAFGMHLVY